MFIRTRLEHLIDRLKPVDLLNRARAVILNRANGGWDYADGEDDDSWSHISLVERDKNERNNKIISGSFAFELNDTFGFPIDLTALILSEKGLSDFKNTYFTVVKNMSESNNESTEFITISGIRALKSRGTMNYQGQVIYTTTITLLYNKKSYIINALTNISNSTTLNEFVKRIKL